MKMTIQTIKNEDALTVSVTGRLDTTTSPELDEELKKSLDGIRDLTMDLEGLEYISSAGLRILLSTQKTMNQQGTMKLINVSSMVMDVFEVTGFADILTIE
jgi:anti-sigma B factor antagonist